MSELEDALSELVRNIVREELAQLQPQEPDGPRYFSVKQAAAFANTTVDTVRNAMRKAPGEAGHLKSERRGRAVVITRQALEDCMEGRS